MHLRLAESHGSQVRSEFSHHRIPSDRGAGATGAQERPRAYGSSGYSYVDQPRR